MQKTPFVAILILTLALVGSLAYSSTVISNLNGEISTLRTEINDIRLKIGSASQTITQQNNTTTTRPTLNNQNELTPQEIFQQIKESVVSVIVRQEQPDTLLPQGGQGSGFIYDNQGHIITNNHVIQGTNSIEVRFLSGAASKARLVATDPFTDIAVIKIDNPNVTLKPVAFGDSSSLSVGEPVVAIGSPFGLGGSLTTGVVSQLGRTFQTVGRYSIPGVIQIDAAINPGNSGGPLLNTRGEVIGINTAIQTQSGSFSGIGLAVPSNTIKKVAPSLIATGKYEHAWLGVAGQDVTIDIAEAIKLKEAKGFIITEIFKDSPAAKAGLKGSDREITINEQPFAIGGDVIAAFNGKPVRGLDEILLYLAENTRPGDTLKVEIIRDSQKQTVPVILGVRPPVQQ